MSVAVLKDIREGDETVPATSVKKEKLCSVLKSDQGRSQKKADTDLMLFVCLFIC